MDSSFVFFALLGRAFLCVMTYIFTFDFILEAWKKDLSLMGVVSMN